MIAKLLLLLAATAAVVTADDDCNCNTDEDNKNVWAFLTSLSKEMEASPDKTKYSVLPAVLSPLVDCDCSEKNRLKRRIIDTPKPVSKPGLEPLYEQKVVRFGDRRCPLNYARIGSLCVEANSLD